MSNLKSAIVASIFAGVCVSVLLVWRMPGLPPATISASAAGAAAAAAVVVMRHCRRDNR